MKSKFLAGICFLVFISCEPRIKNDQITLNEIFDKGKIQLQISDWGCFGGSDEFFTLKKNGDKFKLKNKKTNKQKEVSIAQVDSLKLYLIKRIGKENTHSCTLSQYVKVWRGMKAVDYYHADCSEEMKRLDNILGYSDLT